MIRRCPGFVVNAYAWLSGLKDYCPHDHDGKRPSNGTIRRWLEQKAVQINGQRPTMKCDVGFPIWELVFFPSRGRCTLCGPEWGTQIAELPVYGRRMQSRWGWLPRSPPPPTHVVLRIETTGQWCPIEPKVRVVEYDLVADFREEDD